MQMLRFQGELTQEQLQSAAGKSTLDSMVAKGWIEVVKPRTYRITTEGIAAMVAKIPTTRRS
jgi:hypothetical protein